MRILGIAPEVWISSAALIEDGRVIAAAAEERFNRQKMSTIFPDRAIDYCLQQAGCSLDAIDQVAVAWNPGVHIRSASRRYSHSVRWRGEYLATIPAALLSKSGDPEVASMEEIVHMADGDARIVFVNHHMAHAANAYLLSSFQRAAILTADGRGEEETTTFCIGHDNRIENLHSINLPHSLGLLYGTITEYLGFTPHTDEWKVMALASYGCEDGNEYYPLVRGLVNHLPEGNYELDLTYFTYYLFDNKPNMFTEKLEALLGPRRHRDDPIEQRHSDIARALQCVFEETSTHMLCHLHAQTGETNLALAGGCVMNSVYNAKVLEKTPFKELFISSCPDDSGVSIGAALYVYNCLLDQKDRYPLVDNFWGPEYGNDELERTLQGFKIPFEHHKDIARVAAGLLTEGRLVGWYQGRMEFGQRALGNRSILADPRDYRSKNLVNAAVKYRESFRPFAPSILEEQAHEWFDMPEAMKVP